MDFIRALENDQDISPDKESVELLEKLDELQLVFNNLEELDEGAFDRIEQRVEARDLLLYRMIVGQSNMMLTKKFLELALNGKSVPSTMVKGYLPALKMLDDIVTAGPGYVQMLRLLHQRAKKG
ncbi:MAG: hypothetical protein ACKVJK_03815 [Methylophagaceae bacterium]|jgi:hypothetical protein|tara:strand:- start:707 stop:1078 length:372 start_codon:yes stop_codon:yes gene_type:complete